MSTSATVTRGDRPMPSPVPASTCAAASAPDRSIRLPWMLAAAGLALAFTTFPLRDPDVWWHLAVGRLIGAHGIPATEPFSFAGAPNPWVGQQWLYEWGLARIVDLGGAGTAMVLMGALGSLALLIAGLATRRRDRIPGLATAAAMILGGLVAASVLGVRGQVVTVLGTAVTLLVVTRWREGSTRVVWVLPPLLVVWANLHAGFVTGIVLALTAAATVAAHRRLGGAETASVRTLLGATAAAAAATLLNPAGPRLWGYVLSTFTNPTLTNGIDEWSSPNFHTFWMRVLEVMVVGLVVLWALSRRPDPLDVVLALGAVAATLQAQRNVALVAVVAIPQLATYGTLVWRGRGASGARRRGPRRPLPAGMVVAVAAATTLASLALVVLPEATASATARYEQEHEPAAAASWIAAHMPEGTRLYSTYEWGGYLAYRFPAGRMVWIYGESAVFGDQRLQDYLVVHDLESGWQAMLARNGMRAAVLPVAARETTALVEVGWVPVCHDRASDAVVLAQDLDRPPARDAVPPDPRTAPAC